MNSVHSEDGRCSEGNRIGLIPLEDEQKHQDAVENMKQDVHQPIAFGPELPKVIVQLIGKDMERSIIFEVGLGEKGFNV